MKIKKKLPTKPITSSNSFTKWSLFGGKKSLGLGNSLRSQVLLITNICNNYCIFGIGYSNETYLGEMY